MNNYDNEYNTEVVTEKEVIFAKNNNKKVVTIITRSLLGIFGIDKYIMKCKKRGTEELVITLLSIGIPILSLLFLLIPLVGYGLFSIIVFFSNVITFGRCLYFLITGLKMISLTSREIAIKYEKMM